MINNIYTLYIFLNTLKVNKHKNIKKSYIKKKVQI